MSAQAGILYTDAQPVSDLVLGTLSTINADYGPDGCGLYVGDGIALLSFALHFDHLSQSERQPVHAADGSVVTWDGRLDNRDDLIVLLHSDLADGTPTDADLVALALSKWGDRALRSAIGDWSLVRWNASCRELLLARDYTGNRSLYYCQQPEYFVWSTAIEPIVTLCNLTGQINDAFIAGWLVSVTPENHTCYRNIFEVPPGHVLQVRRGQEVVSRSFVSFAPDTIRYRNSWQYEEHYRHVLTQAVKVRLRANRPVWVELSGGCDSSTITCLAHGLVHARAVEAPALQPVSIVTPGAPESDEHQYIESVEAFCHLRSIRTPFQGQFEIDPPSDTPNLIGADGTFRSTDALACEAHSHVLLSGELGDVVTSPATVDDVLLSHVLSGRLLSFLVDSVSHCRAERQTLVTLWRAFAKNIVVSDAPRRSHEVRARYRLISRVAPPRAVSIEDVILAALRPAFIEATPIPRRSVTTILAHMPRRTHTLLLALHHYISSHILRSRRQANTVAVTFPFAHRPLIEFLLAIPPRVVWAPQFPRWFVRSALREILPPAIVSRSTKGYASPAVSRYMSPTIASSAATIEGWQIVTRGYADRSALADLLQSFLAGAESTQVPVYRFLSAEALLRRASSRPKESSVPRHFSQLVDRHQRERVGSNCAVQ
jgi:asparagine synthase (glutamine-hydrolysing)